MSLILVATDFSKVADNALKYACDLALIQNADIGIVHTYTVPLTLGDISLAMPIADFQKDAEVGMDQLLTTVKQQYPQIIFKNAIIYGDVVDGINQFTDEHGKPMMVIAGNHYTPDNPAWMDSTLLEAFRNLQYPVLAIPDDVTYAQVRKIGFVYDNVIDGSRDALRQLTALSDNLGAELHIFYAQKDVHTMDNTSEINEEAKEILASAHPLYHYAYEANIDEAIMAFAGKYHLDWLIVMPRKHSLLESLFHKSHTKALVNNAFIPVMALHEDK